MQVNVTNTRGVIQELETQRNGAFARAAGLAGANAELTEAVKAANERIKELEAQVEAAKPAEEAPQSEAA